MQFILSLLVAGTLGGSMTATGKGVYTAEVDLDDPFEERLKATKAEADTTITESRFGGMDGCGTITVRFEMRPYYPLKTTTEVIQALRARGLRPATAEELIAFVTVHPHFQTQFPIAALDTIWRDDGPYGRVIYATVNQGRRVIDIEETEGQWAPNVRFLAVRIR